MYLKRLEIFGFKSFAEKTSLDFLPGITIIVGPNGCGKSNILDAIKWALGEQSTRSLRASRMEDVIFNGTDRIPALNMAEVSVWFDNSDRVLNYDADEVVITRRLFRSGESEYLLNRNQVRLKDINELLMGTGIGAEAYSIVEQGKIDLLLSAKPDERRLVFDEAAGITKYKSKKKETLRKLAETEQNLLRVADIMAEVKRQLSSLERQAKKALRYQELMNELKEKETCLALHSLSSIEGEREKLSAELETIKASIHIKEKAQGELSAEIERLRMKVIELEEKINEVQEKLSARFGDYEQAGLKISMNEERIKEFEHQKELFYREGEQIAGRLDERRRQICAMEGELEELRARREEVERKRAEVDRRLSEILSSVVDKERHLENLKARLFELNRAHADLVNEQKERELDIRSVESELRYVRQQKGQLQKELEDIHRRVDETKRRIEEDLARISEIQDRQIPSAEDRIREASKRYSALEAELEALKAEVSALNAQMDMLSHLEARYITLPEPRKVDLWIEKAGFDIGSIIARVEQVIEERDNWIHVVCEARALPRHLSELKDRKTELERLVGEKDRELMEAKKALDEAYEYKRAFDRQIDSIRSKVEQDRRLLSSLESALKESQAQMDVLNEEEVFLTGKLNEIKGEVSRISERLAELSREMEEVSREVAEAERSLDELREKRISLEQELSRISADKEVVEAAIENLMRNIEQIKKSVDQDRKIAEEREQLRSSIEEKIKALHREIEQLRLKAQEWESEVEELRRERDALKEEYQDLRRNLEAVEGQRDQIISGIEDLRKGMYDLELRLQQLDFREQALASHLRDLYGIDLLEAREKTVPPIGLDLEVLRSEIDALKQKIKRLGAVSTVAIEEYEELQKRYEFLSGQHDDLVKAKQSLKETINKLNRTSEELFLQTFGQIREEFKRFFRMLFGGGSADISLSDESDVLESGIEITARPPGKQLRNISLLSGGEKSLTAIALIFAIFKVKPSPFCVLDEVDAALDESNVDRFIRLLREFSKKTQFIVISHNKKTIASGDVVYGVTMPTSGVSRVISVKLVDTPSGRRDSLEFVER